MNNFNLQCVLTTRRIKVRDVDNGLVKVTAMKVAYTNNLCETTAMQAVVSVNVSTKIRQFMYVVVQFYLWFKFYFPLF